MISPKIRSYVTHYAYGLTTSSFNGGVTSVIAFLGLAGGAAVGAGVAPMDLKQLGVTFVSSVGLHALIYFQNHPIPEDLDQVIKVETTNTVKVTETTSVPVPAPIQTTGIKVP